MRLVELGKSGIQISQLGMGALHMGTATDEATSFAMLDRFLDAGGTFLDTANAYTWWNAKGTFGGQSEEILGRWLARRGRRDDVVIATKGAAVPTNLDAVFGGGDDADWDAAYRCFDGAGADNLRRSVDDSLRRLQTDHIDLYFVHVDDRSTPLEETLGALADMIADGKLRAIGWSNVRTWRLERIRQLCHRYGWPGISAVQNMHSYLRLRPGTDTPSIVNDEQLDYARAHDDLTLVAYSPQLGGLYEDPTKRQGFWPWGQYEGPDTDARLAALEELSTELGCTKSQLVLAWLLHQTSPVVAPLIGPRTPEQLESALPALDLKLTDEHLDRLDAAGV